MNKGLYDAVVEAGSLQSIENLSWHDPIYCKIKLNNLDLQLETHEYMAKPSWNKASIEQKANYSDHLEARLANITVPECITRCKDFKCKNHWDELNIYCENVLEAIDEVTSVAIPVALPCTKSGSLLSGWNDIVKPYKDEASHWRSLWMCAGRANNSILYTNMKSSKAQYKYAIRRLKKISRSDTE